MKEKVSFKDLENVFEDEYKIYLSLENCINEFMAGYENEPSEELKSIIIKLIHNAKNQNILLLDLVSRYYYEETKLDYSEILSNKLAELDNIEGKLKSSKTR